MYPAVIILDGHDGAGKTTLARMLAARIGATYLKPFDNSLGDLIAWLYHTEQFEAADVVARLAVQKAQSTCQNGDTVIFDRHWMSLFTVLPEPLWSHWYPLPRTILCWADPQTTCCRLQERGESVGDPHRHSYWCDRYLALARQYDVSVVDTSHSPAERSLESIVDVLRKG